ncbi:hypothetical protein [Pseudomonas sp. fls2-241-R2A-110]|uniref:hypothetical protein n=1 Tax=Pseudomonas sp. fls2-241-R2A-110 TaxID=3040311 RepID=UPI00255309C2|nr:hypothetical protein [Pseudomonas sp. fls2-241-R2A-110]
MDDTKSSNIVVKSANLKSKCWVVRPGVRYRFIEHFLDDGFVAMGHLDDEWLEQESLDCLRDAEGERIYSICSEINEKLSINTRAQVISFVNEMCVGDVVFTLSKNYIYPGVITSDPIVERLALSANESFQVRRRVNWGDRIDREKIPVTLTKSFNAYQAVFSLGESSKEIHHWLSSFFISDEHYFSSLRVDQAGSLSHHSLKNLSEIMDRLQVLSILIGECHGGRLDQEFVENLSLDQILSFMSQFDEQGLLLLTSQQVVMSPGDLWYGLKSTSVRTGVAFLVGVALLFDQSIAFADPHLNAVCKEVTPIVAQNIETLKKDVDFVDVKKKLWVGVSKQNKSFVEREQSPKQEFPNDGDPRYSTR